MNAADVLARADWDTAVIPNEVDGLVAALLAHGEQGVAILPDGTLWALEVDDVLGPIVTYRLVPLSAEAGDTLMDEPSTFDVEVRCDELDQSRFEWIVMKWTKSLPRWRVGVIDPALTRKWSGCGKDEVARFDSETLIDALDAAVSFVRSAEAGDTDG